jgi:hypothetical protein
MKLNYKKMIKDINNLVENDFCAEMEYKLLPKSKPYTQKEAKEMSDIISRVYLVSHCLHCESCATIYKTH